MVVWSFWLPLHPNRLNWRMHGIGFHRNHVTNQGAWFCLFARAEKKSWYSILPSNIFCPSPPGRQWPSSEVHATPARSSPPLAVSGQVWGRHSAGPISPLQNWYLKVKHSLPSEIRLVHHTSDHQVQITYPNKNVLCCLWDRISQSQWFVQNIFIHQFVIPIIKWRLKTRRIKNIGNREYLNSLPIQTAFRTILIPNTTNPLSCRMPAS